VIGMCTTFEAGAPGINICRQDPIISHRKMNHHQIASSYRLEKHFQTNKPHRSSSAAARSVATVRDRHPGHFKTDR